MSWFSKMVGTSLRLDNLENLLTQQLEDLYSAEDQLIEALPKMAEAASSQELKSAFQQPTRWWWLPPRARRGSEPSSNFGGIFGSDGGKR